MKHENKKTFNGWVKDVQETASNKDLIIGAILGGQRMVKVCGIEVSVKPIPVGSDTTKNRERQASEQADFLLGVLNS